MRIFIFLFEIVDLPLLLKTNRTIVNGHSRASKTKYYDTIFVDQSDSKRDKENTRQIPTLTEGLRHPAILLDINCGGTIHYNIVKRPVFLMKFAFIWLRCMLRGCLPFPAHK